VLRLKLVRMVLLPLFIALIATALVYRFGPRAGTEKAPEVDLVPAVVATRPIPARTLVELDMVVLRQVPRDLFGTLALSDKKDAVGRVTTVPIAAGEVLLGSRLAAPGGGPTLAFAVPEGKRAITVAVDEVRGVAGFLQPGDRVDVLGTFKPEVAGDDKTLLLLEDIPILAVAQRTTAGEGAQTDMRAYTSVTLAVTPEEAAVVALADERGELRLALRPATPEEDCGVVQVTSAMFRGDAESLADFEFKAQVRIMVVVAEVDRQSLYRLTPGILPGVQFHELGRGALGSLDALVAEGRAAVIDRADLITMNRESARYALTGEYVIRAGPAGQQVVVWQEYGLVLDMVPEAYDLPFIDFQMQSSLRILALGAAAGAGAGAAAGAEADARVREGWGTVRVDMNEVVIITGLVRAEDLTAGPRGGELLVLPPGSVSPEFMAGERELVLIVEPVADRR
jgi:pilus assembly protein CpaB